MLSLKTLLICFYCLIILSEVLGLPGSGGGGRSGAFTGGKSTGSKTLSGSKKGSAKQAVGTNIGGEAVNSPKTAASKAGRTGGSFLSAWGIIWSALFIVVGSAAIYYISIFYPLICAKRGKYDVMEMTAV